MLRRSSKAAAIVLVGAVAAMKPALALDEDPGKGGFYLSLGSFNPSTDDKLKDRSGNASYALGFAWRQSRHFLWEIDFLGYGQDVQIPPSMKPPPMWFTRWNSHATINTTGYGGVVKFIQPLGPFDFYAGGGVGYYSSELKVSGVKMTSPFTFKTVEIAKSDSGYGTQLVAGVDLHTARNQRLGVQYRRMALNPNFGPEIGSTAAGGAMWQLTYRAFFGSCPDCRAR
jgi:hypothetical protein